MAKNENRMFCGTGRRKSSVARVILRPGKGNITVNGRDVREFFPYETNIMDLMQPLVATNNEKTFDITETICRAVSEELRRQRFSETESNFLQDHLDDIMNGITNPEIRAMHPMADPAFR